MKKLTVSTPKGGEGKSSITIIISKFLASMGMRVLVVDLDPQNSTSFHFVKEEDPRNIAKALFSGDIRSNIIQTSFPGLDIVQSDMKLLQQRSMSFHLLNKTLLSVADVYDFCVIDTAPTWDNIVINGLRAADLIIYPTTLKSKFSVKTSVTFKSFVEEEYPEALDKYAILYNRYLDGIEGQEYVSMYEQYHSTFFESHLKQTAQIKDAIDYSSPITDSKQFNVLYPFLRSITGEIFSYLDVPYPEVLQEATLEEAR